MMADFNYIITFVLDVEFLEVDVVKEISVTTPYHSVSLSFKPPRPWKDLTREEQLEYNNNNTLNVPWDEGAIDYKELRNAVYTLIAPGVMKYAKGVQKCDFFSRFFHFKIHNLEDMGCPDASAIQHLINNKENNDNDDDDKKNRPLCPNFPKYPNHYEKCAAINSKLYLKWLANKIKEDPAAAEMARKTSPLRNDAALILM